MGNQKSFELQEKAVGAASSGVFCHDLEQPTGGE